MKPVTVAGRKIEAGAPCFVIAEAGVNHNGRLDLALKLVDAAVAARADAVKFQTFKAERLVTRAAPKADYQKAATRAGESQFEMLKKLELSERDHLKLLAYCKQRGIVFLSSPFDEASADFLCALGVPAFKIGSGELTNLPLLEHIARKKRPIMLSTGMAGLREVETAVRAIRRAGNDRVVLLHCVTQYPADPSTVNLRAMETMRKKFGVPVGFSDHTRGIEIAIGAAALGAAVIEKHFTLDRKMPGPDQRASLEPQELAAMVYAIRVVQSALGDGRKKPQAAELKVTAVARKSLVAARAIRKGARVQKEDIAIKRPGTGLPPSQIRAVLGRIAKANLPEGTVIKAGMFSPNRGRYGRRGDCPAT